LIIGGILVGAGAVSVGGSRFAGQGAGEDGTGNMGCGGVATEDHPTSEASAGLLTVDVQNVPPRMYERIEVIGLPGLTNVPDDLTGIPLDLADANPTPEELPGADEASELDEPVELGSIVDSDLDVLFKGPAPGELVEDSK